MEAIIVLFILGLILCVLVIPVVALVRAGQAARRAEAIERRLEHLEEDLARLRRAPFAPLTSPVAEPSTVSELLRQRRAEPTPAAPEPAAPPPAPPPVSTLKPEPPLEVPPILTPPPPPSPEPPIAPPPQPRPALDLPFPGKPMNWEQFMGVKLFAWVGGLALFLGVVFFVKYSFDHNLVSPAARVALGFLAGLGLLTGGVVLKRKAYATTAQTLISTGVLVLYATTFAAHAFYRFPLFSLGPTFALMTLVTVTAFVLAVRLEAMVVAILGMLGGFLTPVLLSTGEDMPGALFSYIALLDAGLLAVALKRRWFFLAALAAAGTMLTQLAWTAQFFRAEQYFTGNIVLVPMAVLLGFSGLFLGGTGWSRREAPVNAWFSGATLALLALALGYTAYFLGFTALGDRPGLVFSYLLAVNAGVLVLMWLDPRLNAAQPLAGLGAFLVLGGWTWEYLTEARLPLALLFYLGFALLNTAAPLVLNRLRPGSTPVWWAQGFPVIALVLVLAPIFQLQEQSFLVWPFVLLVDVLAVLLAMLTASLMPVIAVLLLTLLVVGASLMRIPITFEGFPLWLVMLAFFSVCFAGVGVWFARRLQAQPESAEGDDWQRLASYLPAMSAALPFLLLMLAVARLPLTNPSSVFGLALLLVVLLLGLARWFRLEGICGVALACVFILELVWHVSRFNPDLPGASLAWYLAFHAVFAVFPFVFRRTLADRLEPWATAAGSGLLHFLLVYWVVRAAYANDFMGLLPAAFTAPALLSLWLAMRHLPDDNPKRFAILAWFGGGALCFITLIFPIQFDRQWITIGWALEGVALLWLFRHIPHPGLRWVGAGLLLVAFVRLALNPAVLTYQPATGTPVFNWYLYAYGIVIACLFVAARLVKPPQHQIGGVNAPPVFLTLGTVLAFLLLNIQIADAFTEAGEQALTFKFSGNFARDMTYTIAWGAFAFGLLVAGIVRQLPAARWAALALLGAAMLKLFLHDLARLEALYRIGAFIGAAIIAMAASFAYQRFLAGAAKPESPASKSPRQ